MSQVWVARPESSKGVPKRRRQGVPAAALRTPFARRSGRATPFKYNWTRIGKQEEIRIMTHFFSRNRCLAELSYKAKRRQSGPDAAAPGRRCQGKNSGRPQQTRAS